MKRARMVVPCESRAGLDSELSRHFGRCSNFAVVEVHAGEIVSCEQADNPHGGHHAHGAVPAFCRELGAEVMLCGGIGRRAVAHFEEAGVAVSAGYFGTVREAVADFLANGRRAPGPCGHDHPHSCGGH
jgi:predicted Fe-Mo cluster-binding NifX family protein